MWQELAKKELKGADPAEKLTWHTAEGIGVKPMYTAADVASTQNWGGGAAGARRRGGGGGAAAVRRCGGGGAAAAVLRRVAGEGDASGGDRARTFRIACEKEFSHLLAPLRWCC